MNTNTIAGRREYQIRDALSLLMSDNDVSPGERLSALRDLQEEIEGKIETTEQIVEKQKERQKERESEKEKA